ncbi:MAG: HU family DNA-binding protein [Alloprevotella sp.]|nr:HU family DNA-binding protein [Alloprevotella sp.]
MTNKDFLSSMTAQTGMKKAEVQRLVQHFTTALAENMEDGDTTAIKGFGVFEMKKKLERIVVNPATHRRQLVPPRQTITFKAGATLKEKAL